VIEVFATAPLLSVTVTVALKVPACVGLPLSVPALSATPPGSPLAVKVYDPEPPLAEKLADTEAPTAVLIELVEDEMVRVVGGGDAGAGFVTATE
jgi:hypothetical protein